jgi:hypothetical protein
MKKIFCIIVALNITNVFAEDKPIIPNMFKDSKITTTLKNGRQVNFDGNEWMVVRRKTPKKLTEVALTALELPPTIAEEPSRVIVKKSYQKMNRARLIGGVGPKGLDASYTANYVEIKSKSGVIGGVGYDRMLDEAVSVGGQVLSNGTMALSLGLDF